MITLTVITLRGLKAITEHCLRVSQKEGRKSE
jgi:hypothetical protein